MEDGKWIYWPFQRSNIVCNSNINVLCAYLWACIYVHICPWSRLPCYTKANIRIITACTRDNFKENDLDIQIGDLQLYLFEQWIKWAPPTDVINVISDLQLYDHYHHYNACNGNSGYSRAPAQAVMESEASHQMLRTRVAQVDVFVR